MLWGKYANIIVYNIITQEEKTWQGSKRKYEQG